ncbi:MAG: hypothetical protein IH899_12910 [Planctomycetes bacterium]|nr:hypothetical protein [Planctomycetota bacterium]
MDFNLLLGIARTVVGVEERQEDKTPRDRNASCASRTSSEARTLGKSPMIPRANPKPQSGDFCPVSKSVGRVEMANLGGLLSRILRHSFGQQRTKLGFFNSPGGLSGQR